MLQAAPAIAILALREARAYWISPEGKGMLLFVSHVGLFVKSKTLKHYKQLIKILD